MIKSYSNRQLIQWTIALSLISGLSHATELHLDDRKTGALVPCYNSFELLKKNKDGVTVPLLGKGTRVVLRSSGLMLLSESGAKGREYFFNPSHGWCYSPASAKTDPAKPEQTNYQIQETLMCSSSPLLSVYTDSKRAYPQASLEFDHKEGTIKVTDWSDGLFDQIELAVNYRTLQSKDINGGYFVEVKSNRRVPETKAPSILVQQYKQLMIESEIPSTQFIEITQGTWRQNRRCDQMSAVVEKESAEATAKE